MSAANRHAALAALGAAKPTLARLEVSRNAEDGAADLIEGWTAVESVLRAWIDAPPTLTGQALIREARQRELLSLAATHGLLEYLAAAERAQRVDYRPTTRDMESARRAAVELQEAVVSGSGGEQRAVGARPALPALPASPASVPSPDREERSLGDSSAIAEDTGAVARASGRSRWATAGTIGGIVFGLALAIVKVITVVFDGPPRELSQGAKLLAEGRREGARQQFEQAAREHPTLAMPYVYLGRMAREDGDIPRAQAALKRAIEIESGNGLALREYASLFLATGNLDLARRFYVHAITADSTDKLAMGFLGCTLIRMNRAPEGLRWIERAGEGDWSVCARQVTPPMPGRSGGPTPVP